MNDFNQVLIEGKIEDVTKNGNVCDLRISILRTYKENGETAVSVTYVTIRTSGVLADICEKKCTPCITEIRCVGRLMNEGASDKVIVLAEHIEFKPHRK